MGKGVGMVELHFWRLCEEVKETCHTPVLLSIIVAIVLSPSDRFRAHCMVYPNAAHGSFGSLRGASHSHSTLPWTHPLSSSACYIPPPLCKGENRVGVGVVGE